MWDDDDNDEELFRALEESRLYNELYEKPRLTQSLGSASRSTDCDDPARPSTSKAQTSALVEESIRGTFSHTGNNALKEKIYEKEEELYDGPEAEGFNLREGQYWVYPTNDKYPLRTYQKDIVEKALFNNTLVSLPTGLGKTFIAAVVMYNFYKWYPKGKVIFMAPTKPLVAQQIDNCCNIMGILRTHTAEMTGTTHSRDRAAMWQEKRVFFLTPQIVQNDLSAGICPANAVKCVVIDEAHRAVGDYAYTMVIRSLNSFEAQYRVLALSATPGSDLQSVQKVVSNLMINLIEVRSEESLDIMKYTHERKVEIIVVSIGSTILRVQRKYLEIIQSYATRLLQRKVLFGSAQSLTRFSCLKTWDDFRRESAQRFDAATVSQLNADFAVVLSLVQGSELLQTYGLRLLLNHLKGVINSKEKPNTAGLRLAVNEDLKTLMEEIDGILNPVDLDDEEEGQDAPRKQFIYGHPKLDRLQQVVLSHFELHEQQGSSTRTIIFCEYREGVAEIHDMLKYFEPLVKPVMFMGQASGKTTKGIPQKLQLEIMEKFRRGTYNTLISTSVGEEGLDIGEVDLIICFDAKNSPVRQVQRMGRTGRKREGRIIMLVTQGKEERKYKESLFKKHTVNTALLSRENLVGFLYEDCPRMLPPGLHPKFVQRAIEAPTNKMPSGQQDLRKMLLKRSSASSTSNRIGSSSDRPFGKVPYLTEEELQQLKETWDVETCCSFDRIPDREEVWARAEDERMDSESPLKVDLSCYLEFLRFEQRTHLVGNSSDSELLVHLLSWAEDRRDGLAATQCGVLAQGLSSTQLWPVKRKKRGRPAGNANVADVDEPPAKKKRGRPRKVTVVPELHEPLEMESKQDAAAIFFKPRRPQFIEDEDDLSQLPRHSPSKMQEATTLNSEQKTSPARLLASESSALNTVIHDSDDENLASNNEIGPSFESQTPRRELLSTLLVALEKQQSLETDECDICDNLFSCRSLNNLIPKSNRRVKLSWTSVRDSLRATAHILPVLTKENLMKISQQASQALSPTPDFVSLIPRNDDCLGDDFNGGVLCGGIGDFTQPASPLTENFGRSEFCSESKTDLIMNSKCPSPLRINSSDRENKSNQRQCLRESLVNEGACADSSLQLCFEDSFVLEDILVADKSPDKALTSVMEASKNSAKAAQDKAFIKPLPAQKSDLNTSTASSSPKSPLRDLSTIVDQGSPILSSQARKRPRPPGRIRKFSICSETSSIPSLEIQEEVQRIERSPQEPINKNFKEKFPTCRYEAGSLKSVSKGCDLNARDMTRVTLFPDKQQELIPAHRVARTMKNSFESLPSPITASPKKSSGEKLATAPSLDFTICDDSFLQASPDLAERNIIEENVISPQSEKKATDAAVIPSTCSRPPSPRLDCDFDICDESLLLFSPNMDQLVEKANKVDQSVKEAVRRKALEILARPARTLTQQFREMCDSSSVGFTQVLDLPKLQTEEPSPKHKIARADSSTSDEYQEGGKTPRKSSDARGELVPPGSPDMFDGFDDHCDWGPADSSESVLRTAVETCDTSQRCVLTQVGGKALHGAAVNSSLPEDEREVFSIHPKKSSSPILASSGAVRKPSKLSLKRRKLSECNTHIKPEGAFNKAPEKDEQPPFNISSGAAVSVKNVSEMKSAKSVNHHDNEDKGRCTSTSVLTSDKPSVSMKCVEEIDANISRAKESADELQRDVADDDDFDRAFEQLDALLIKRRTKKLSLSLGIKSIAKTKSPEKSEFGLRPPQSLPPNMPPKVSPEVVCISSDDDSPIKPVSRKMSKNLDITTSSDEGTHSCFGEQNQDSAAFTKRAQQQPSTPIDTELEANGKISAGKIKESNKDMEIPKQGINARDAERQGAECLDLSTFCDESLLSSFIDRSSPKKQVSDSAGNEHSFTKDSDVFESVNNRRGGRKRKRKKMLSKKKCAFVESEAEESGDARHSSSDGESTSLDGLDSSFINDSPPEQTQSMVDMHAKYLESVKSPFRAVGRFKIPDRVPRATFNVYSQLPDASELNQTYANDSFCVDDEPTQYEENDMSALEIAEARLKAKRKEKRRKRKQRVLDWSQKCRSDSENESSDEEKVCGSERNVRWRRVIVLDDSESDGDSAIRNVKEPEISASNGRCSTPTGFQKDFEEYVKVNQNSVSVSKTSLAEDNDFAKLLDDDLDFNIASLASLCDNPSNGLATNSALSVESPSTSKSTFVKKTPILNRGGVSEHVHPRGLGLNDRFSIKKPSSVTRVPITSIAPVCIPNQASKANDVSGVSTPLMSTAKVEVIVAARLAASSSQLFSKLRLTYNFGISVRSNCCADFVISWRLGICRVAVSDLKDRKKLEQVATTLKNYFFKPFMIVERDRVKPLGGDQGSRKNKKPPSKVPPVWTPGSCHAIALLRQAGVHLLFSQNWDETASLVAKLARKENSAGHGIDRDTRHLPDNVENVLQFFCSLPCINVALALKLLAKFPSISLFLARCSSVREIETTTGLDINAARKIHNVLCEVHISP